MKPLNRPEALPLLAPPQTSVDFDALSAVSTLTDDPLSHDFRRIVCLHCGHTIDVPVYCGNRFCEICARPRALRIRRRIDFCIKNTPKLAGYRWKFLTLTIANEPDLSKMLKRLVKAFRRFRQRKFWKKSVHGGCFVIEVTGRPGSWHAHIHAIIFARFMDWRSILNTWQKVSGGQHIDIRQIPPGAALGYVTMYTTKTPDLPLTELQIVSDALKGFRLFNPFGSWFKINREFEVVKCGCPKCGMSDWMPEDQILYAPRFSDAWLRYEEVQFRRKLATIACSEVPS